MVNKIAELSVLGFPHSLLSYINKGKIIYTYIQVCIHTDLYIDDYEQIYI